MRRLALLAVLLALPAAAALEPWVVLLDWQRGTATAPTTPFATSPLAERFTFEASACHPSLLLDLLYSPDEGMVAVQDVGEMAVVYEFRAEVWNASGLVADARVQRSGYGMPLAILEEAGPHELRLSLGWGANVDWEARLRGRLAIDDPACNPPP